ncbi:MAG TPA: T9SS type A sorting domain-containing protein [Saprospiraceae bacterium]|nr:T9SS type A sorting domain-containing protein [Saprospiraceae bacterium]
MRVMPNPVSDLLYVQFMERKSDELSVTLADLSGRKIFQNRIPPESDQTNFDVSGIAEGVYFLIVANANRVMETRKNVVIH